jgi:exosortase
VLALFWWKRKELMKVPFQNWWPALFIIAFALVLHVIGYLTMQARISIIALFVGIYGLTGLVWGKGWLHASFFPFFLFAFCVPLGSLGQAVTTPLRHLVAIIVTGIAHLGIAPDLIREGTQLSDAQHSFHYDIAPACSGIRSLIALLALTTIYGFISFKSTWRRLLMIASAVPLAVIGNVVRLTFTVVVAEAFGQNAGSKVEQKFGFVTFAVAIVLVVLIGNWLHEGKAKQPLPLEVKPA